MVDRLTQIEDTIIDMLKSIDGTLQSTGYTYYTSTGQVEIQDEVIGGMVNRSLGQYDHIDYTLEQDGPEINVEVDSCFFTNSTKYLIRGRVKNKVINDKVGGSNPRRAIKIKCNQVLSDLKFLFSQKQGTQLYKMVNNFDYTESTREWYDGGTVDRAADVLVYFDLTYAQSHSNPNQL
jgi:hypothetical protein